MTVVAGDGLNVVPPKATTNTVVPFMPTKRRELSELEVNRRTRCLLELVEELREVYPRMELGQLKVLLQVLLQPGVRGAELLETNEDVTKSGLYKTLNVLSDERSPGAVEGRTTGLDLITKIPDPEDGRAVLLLPTRRGVDLKHRLAKIMAGDTDDGTA